MKKVEEKKTHWHVPISPAPTHLLCQWESHRRSNSRKSLIKKLYLQTTHTSHEAKKIIMLPTVSLNIFSDGNYLYIFINAAKSIINVLRALWRAEFHSWIYIYIYKLYILKILAKQFPLNGFNRFMNCFAMILNAIFTSVIVIVVKY